MPRARPLNILLEGMRFWGRHGVLARERRQGGPFEVSLEVAADVPYPERDRLSDTVDYRRIYAKTKSLVERRRFRTVEALALAVAAATLKLPKVVAVKARVTKLAPPLGGATAAVEIKLSRPGRV